MERTDFSSHRERPANRLSVVRQRIAGSPVVTTLIVVFLVFLFFSFKAPRFLSLYALSNVLTFSSIYGIIVVGVAFLMISGEFDLSVGSTLAVSGYVFLLSLLAGVAPVIAMLLALAVSALLGLINGLIVVWSGIPSFIATLGTLLAYRGIVRVLGGARSTIYSPENPPVLFSILNGYPAGINKLAEPAGNLRVCSLWFIGVVILMSFVLMRTRYGNWNFAVGGNRGAALSQGVNVKKVLVINFTLSGFLAGLAGVLLFAQRSSMNELMGGGLELTAVAAAVVGGCSLSGGSGRIVSAALGMLLLSMVEQGLVLMGVPFDIFRAILGAVIIVSVVVNSYLSRQA